MLVDRGQKYSIFVLDSRGRVASWNAEAERALGYGAQEAVGEHFSLFFSPEDVEQGKPEEQLRAAAKDGQVEEEAWRVRKDGSRFWADVVVTPLRGEGGELHGFAKMVRDITECKEVEKALRSSLRESRRLTDNILGSISDAFYALDHGWRFTYINERALHILQRMKGEELTCEELLGKDVWEVFSEAAGTTFEYRCHEAYREHKTVDFAQYWPPVDSWFEVHVYPSDEGLFLYIRDITEHMRAEDALRQTLDSLLALFEAGKIFTSSLNLEEIGSSLLGITREILSLRGAIIDQADEQGRPSRWRSAGSQDVLAFTRDQPEIRSVVREVWESGSDRSLELWLPSTESPRLIGLFLPLRVRNRVIGVLEAYSSEALTQRDLWTLSSLANQAASALENARLFEKLAESKQELHEMVGRMMVAQEEERRKVAYEIHDGLTQLAVAAYHRLEELAEHHSCGCAESEQELAKIMALCQRVIGEARRLIANLRPTTLDDFGLAAAIRMQVDELRAEGFEVSYEEALGEDELPVILETALFRVAQEALTNARKHAKTNRVHVALRRREDVVRLEISDLGRGFDPTKVKGGNAPGERVGISSMHERIALLGGDFHIRSRPGVGTSVLAQVCLPQIRKEVGGGV